MLRKLLLVLFTLPALPAQGIFGLLDNIWSWTLKGVDGTPDPTPATALVSQKKGPE